MATNIAPWRYSVGSAHVGNAYDDVLCHLVLQMIEGNGRCLGFLLEQNGAKPMARFYAKAAVWMAVILLALSFGHNGTFAASPGVSSTPEKTIPQGKDPPGADNGEGCFLQPIIRR